MGKKSGRKQGRRERERKGEMTGKGLYFGAYARCTDKLFSWPLCSPLKTLNGKSDDHTDPLGPSQIPSSFEEESIAVTEHHFLEVLERSFSASWKKKITTDWYTLIS